MTIKKEKKMRRGSIHRMNYFLGRLLDPIMHESDETTQDLGKK